MAQTPDLFVVCKNCGNEVSPYITECPYCGTRLRKRAPKIERDGTVSERARPAAAPSPARRGSRAFAPTRSRASAATSPPGPTRRSLLVVLSLFGYLLLFPVSVVDVALFGPIDGEWWRVATSPFLYTNVWYELVAVTAIAVYGWLLERRHGPWWCSPSSWSAGWAASR